MNTLLAKGQNMTEDLIRQLIAAGLTKQQATSVTAETLTKLYMKDDAKLLISEAKRQVQEMNDLLNDLKTDYYNLKQEMKKVSETLLAVVEAQNKYGEITDEKAKTVIALYSSLLSMNQNAGADSSESVRCASFNLYAFLGGQAKREISYQDFESIDISDKRQNRRSKI